MSMTTTTTMHRPRGGAITGPALWAAAKTRVALWDRLARDPEQAQLRALRANCQAARASAFGRQHGLDYVTDHLALVRRVPLRTYAELEPWLLRMRAGEPDVLVGGHVPYFARTAGSTARATKLKYLPISETQIAWQQRQAFDVMARYLDLSNDRALTAGYAIALLEPPRVDWDGRVGITSNPGLMQLHAPCFASHVSLPEARIHAIDDYDAKISAIAEAYLDHDVRAVAGTTCWLTMLFDRVIATARARGRDVATAHEIWPNLRALFGGGVNAAAYRPVLSAKVGGRTWLMDTYNATEGGVFAVTDREDDDALLVVPDRGVFYEFIPRSEHGKENATRLPLWKVEPGVDYSVALTTSSGLIGYLIGDVVRFKSVFPHRLVVRGRIDGELSIAQEMTSAGQIEEAAARATARHDVVLSEMTTAIAARSEATTTLGGYIVFVELQRAPASLDAFAASLDEELASANALYGRYRTLHAFEPLKVIALPRGAMARFARATGRRGLQTKLPRIVNEGERDLLALLATSPTAESFPHSPAT